VATTAIPATLPTCEELDAADSELHSLHDGGSIDLIARRLFKVIQQDKVPATWADVGMLLDYVNWVRIHTDMIRTLAEKIEMVALNDLAGVIREGGRMVSTPTFDEYGSDYYPRS
jgi:hypothetical protein